MAGQGMPRSNQLRALDIAQIQNLIHECRDLGDDPNHWREHFGAGLARLTDSEGAIVGTLAGLRRAQIKNVGGVVWGFGPGGFNLDAWIQAVAYLENDPNYSTTLNSYRNHFVEEDGIALQRSKTVSDSEWYRSLEFESIIRPAGGDRSVIGFVSSKREPDLANGAILLRAKHRPDYSERQRLLVQTLLQEIAPFVESTLASFKDPSPFALPPRVRQVLRCLLEGDSDKQIASRLGISSNTVNQYTKVIYRHFAVRSRHELMAIWIRRLGHGFSWEGNKAEDEVRM
jgi:DNA-binding CsgD family transcriptional regulator